MRFAARLPCALCDTDALWLLWQITLAFAATCALTRRYPSLFRAYNLCYTTLLHPDDVANLPADDIITTPTGALHQCTMFLRWPVSSYTFIGPNLLHFAPGVSAGDKFVKPSVRKGVLPSILAALIQVWPWLCWAHVAPKSVVISIAIE